MHSLTKHLADTLIGLEAGLKVRHIAEPVEKCGPGDSVEAAFEDPRFAPFDQLAVSDNGRIVGVVERPAELQRESVRKRMRPLDDQLLVSGDLALLRFIPTFARLPRYRLVLLDDKIDGIVTRSDLLKLPVRTLTFTLVTHLELCMADWIRLKYPDDSWVAELSDGRQAKVREKFTKLQTNREELDLLECTDFCDKRTLVKKRWPDDKGLFERDLKRVEALRDLVVHAATFVENYTSVQRFIENFEIMRLYTERFGEMLACALSIDSSDPKL